MKPIRFTRSARRHRIGKTHALYVMNTAEPLIEDRGITWIGELTVVLVERPEVFLVIHVMPNY